jgi:hypothetical protein
MAKIAEARLMSSWPGRWPRLRREAALPLPPLSNILSDMKTFTVRDPDRRPAVVLDACDKEGVVRIRRRTGQSYTIRPDEPKSSKVSAEARRRWLEEHFAWLERTFPKPVSARQTALVDRLIAGE